MKATGIVRRVDDLGRVVIPKAVRKTMGIKENDPLEIFVDKETNGLVLIPYHCALSDKVKAVARQLEYSWLLEEEREIAEELKNIAKKLEKIEENA